MIPAGEISEPPGRLETPIHGAPAPARVPCLVIGWGNDLRGDDAAGCCVAERVAAWARPDLAVLRLHQLAPELAEALAATSRAVFVDAAPADDGAACAPCISRLTGPTAAPAPPLLLGHHMDPRALLGLAQNLYGCAPDAWLVAIPAHHFELGAPLSPLTARGVDLATAQIANLLQTWTT